MNALFSITCTTCDARLAVRNAAAIGQILSCPKCHGMIKVEPPPDWKPPAEASGAALSADHDQFSAEGERVLIEAGSEDGAAERFDHAWASSTQRRWQRFVIIGTVATSVVLLAVGTWRYLGERPQPLDRSRAAQQPRVRSEAPAVIDRSQPRAEAEHAGETSPTAARAGQSHDLDAAAVEPPPRASADARNPSHDETAAGAVAADEEPAALREPVPVSEAEAPPPEPMAPPIDVTARLADRLAIINFDAVPLTDFLEFVSQMSTIPITLDVDRLTSMGLALSSPVSVNMPDATVAEILHQALSPHGLAYEVVDGQLRVSIPSETRDSLLTVRYRVDDLVEGRDKALERFAVLVRRLVEPDSWGTEQPEGTIQIDGDSLVVDQTATVHRRVLALCERLRLARGGSLRGGKRSDSISLATHHDRAREVLDLPLKATFFEPTRLAQIVGYLERSAEIEILVDWLSLWTEGIYHDAKATLRCDGRPLREALEAITEPLDLTYRVVDERTLEITTRRADARRPVLEIYSIGELLAQGQTAESVTGRLGDELAKGWSEVGTAAVIEFDAASGSLLVSDSQRAQRRIEQLLAQWQAPPAGDRAVGEP